jgi:Janus/Ocnus family (Ocnus)
MQTTFIDYSRHYYENIAGEPLPPRREGKFVQIWLGDTEEFIVVAPWGLASYHAHIVERFLTERGVTGNYSPKRDEYHHQDNAWTVIGGGRFELDDEARTLRLYSRSIAYGPYEQSGLADRLSASASPSASPSASASLGLANHRLTVE